MCHPPRPSEPAPNALRRVVLVPPRDARERRGFPGAHAVPRVACQSRAGGRRVVQNFVTGAAAPRDARIRGPVHVQHRGTVADALGPSAVRASVRAGRATSVQLQVSQSVPGGQDASVRGITHRGDGGAKLPRHGGVKPRLDVIRRGERRILRDAEHRELAAI